MNDPGSFRFIGSYIETDKMSRPPREEVACERTCCYSHAFTHARVSKSCCLYGFPVFNCNLSVT